MRTCCTCLFSGFHATQMLVVTQCQDALGIHRRRRWCARWLVAVSRPGGEKPHEMCLRLFPSRAVPVQIDVACARRFRIYSSRSRAPQLVGAEVSSMARVSRAGVEGLLAAAAMLCFRKQGVAASPRTSPAAVRAECRSSRDATKSDVHGSGRHCVCSMFAERARTCR